MSISVFVPADTVAVALNADKIAAQIQAQADACGIAIQIVRNGSRGLLWLEPLIEVACPAGRIAYGPVNLDDVDSLFEADFLHGGAHQLNLGLTEEIPYLKNQERLTFARVGITDPLSLQDYTEREGYAGLRSALTMSPSAIVDLVTDSGLRGRGGAAFPTGIKWKTVLNTASTQKYIACNADEGDSGSFADRMLMEGDPYALIEGMTIAALAVGASMGYIYVRCEYPRAIATLEAAIRHAKSANWLGDNIQGSNLNFDIEVRKGAGAYVCGEETSMLESLEGRRGIVRSKPPLPAISGLFGKPTVINNVLTLATVPVILAKGAKHYKNYGIGRSRGTLPFQLAGNIKQGGLIEKAFGVSLNTLLYEYGKGCATGRPIKTVQVGGPLGSYLPESQWDTPMDYEAYTALWAVLGHGGIVVHDDSADMKKLARYAMKFCEVESCGKCTPCRIGSTRGVEILDKIIAGDTQQLPLLEDLCNTMLDGSMCAMGGMTPYPVLSALKHYPQEFGTGEQNVRT